MDVILAKAAEFCRDQVQRVGKEALVMWSDQHQLTAKGRADFFTEVDLHAERLLVNSIKDEFPDHGILTEEVLSENVEAPWLWVIDPIDGTMNYISGIPFFSVSMALLHHGQPVVGAIADPYHEEIFHARKGEGAFVGCTPIRVSEQRFLDRCTTATELHAGSPLERHPLLRSDFLQKVGNARMLGSTCLGMAYAAAGRVDLAFYLQTNPWDVAAGSLLVTEAGGSARSWDGAFRATSQGDIIAGNALLVDQFCEAFSPEK